MTKLLRRFLLLGVLLLAHFPVPANVAGAEIAFAGIVFSEEGYALNADFSFEFNQKLTDALAHGLALHFVAELRVERPRWYWFNKVVVHQRLEYRLAYHALTRSYRLNIGGSLHRNFDNLEDAIRTMQHIRNLHLAPQDTFATGADYSVALRFFHDTSQLPKPFQLSALANGEWSVDTGWVKWTFQPEAAAPE